MGPTRYTLVIKLVLHADIYNVSLTSLAMVTLTDVALQPGRGPTLWLPYQSQPILGLSHASLVGAYSNSLPIMWHQCLHALPSPIIFSHYMPPYLPFPL